MVSRVISGYISYQKGIHFVKVSISIDENANTLTLIPTFSVRPGRVEAKAKADCIPIEPASTFSKS